MPLGIRCRITWTTKSDKFREGKPLDRVALRRLLTNPVYIGKVRNGDEVFNGVHEAVIYHTTWEAVQARLKSNEGNSVRYSDIALLKGLSKCGACGASYSQHGAKNGNRRYRHYVCQTAQNQGAAAYPGSVVAAEEIESFVIEKVMAIGRDMSVVAETLAATKTERGRASRAVRGAEAAREKAWQAEEPRQINFTFLISSSAQLCQFLNRRILDIALLNLRFGSIVTANFEPNLSEKSVELFCRDP